jgi:hypothetical protein
MRLMQAMFWSKTGTALRVPQRWRPFRELPPMFLIRFRGADWSYGILLHGLHCPQRAQRCAEYRHIAEGGSCVGEASISDRHAGMRDGKSKRFDLDQSPFIQGRLSCRHMDVVALSTKASWLPISSKRRTRSRRMNS